MFLRRLIWLCWWFWCAIAESKIYKSTSSAQDKWGEADGRQKMWDDELCCEAFLCFSLRCACWWSWFGLCSFSSFSWRSDPPIIRFIKASVSISMNVNMNHHFMITCEKLSLSHNWQVCAHFVKNSDLDWKKTLGIIKYFKKVLVTLMHIIYFSFCNIRTK